MNGGTLLGRNNQMFNNNNVNQLQANQQQQPQGNMNQGNQLLGQLIQLSKGGANLNQQGGGSSSLYNFNNGSDPSFNQFLDLSDAQSNEILKGQSLAEASQLAGVVLQHGFRRIQGPYYNAIRQGMELFRRLDRNAPHLVDDTSELFYNQIMSNNNLYNHIVANSCLQLSALAAMRLMNGENIRGNANVITEMIVDAVGATCGLQLLDWICKNPNGSTIFHNSSQNFKALLRRIESCWDSIKARYDFIPGSVIPWERGQLTATMRKSDLPNYMLDARMGVNFEGLIGNSYQAVQDLTPSHHTVQDHNQGIDPAGYQLMMDYFNRTKCSVEDGTYPTAPSKEERVQRRQDYHNVNDFDREVKSTKYFTMDTRFDYHFDDYFVQIGDTGWYAAENQVMIDIMSKFTNVNTGKKFVKSEVFYLNLEWVSLCRFDVANGTAEIKFLRIPGEDALRFALTDPNRVLPFMWEHNGEVVSSFVANPAETNDFVRDNKVISLGEMQPLEKEPNILSSSNVVKVNSESEAFAKVDASLKTFDKQNHLDAFIMATELNAPFTFEEGVESKKFYEIFNTLVIGEELDYSNSYDMFKSLERKVKQFGSAMFEHFLRTQLTNLVNRWLSECRGFPAENDGVNFFVKLDDLFDDLDAFCELLKNKDHESLRAFLNLADNEFLKSNLQFIKPAKETEEELFKNVDKDDPVAVAVATNEFAQSVVLKRQVMITQLRKEIGPVSNDKVTLMESLSPAVFVIVKEARKRSELLFGRQVPVLLEFETPSGNHTRSATYCDFDQSVMNISALKGLGELILLRTVD
ncbi:hypothetical protein PS2_0119 [Aeromonas phage PS2]|uniref:Uncharacterized protein n=1 Tax=Aeromonas phage PS1 TaxID=2591406 RepID=A0A514TV25_9CAUD|nr:hypothetical protein PQC64_gp144 [Aeromonas phage PS1]QDJ96878.1 hypothetical protein PS1_0119 [Aeromonas phage PS1]QFR59510.1 hypothetical protein PS2_0119 [Aeromonas phage PS2]